MMNVNPYVHVYLADNIPVADVKPNNLLTKLLWRFIKSD